MADKVIPRFFSIFADDMLRPLKFVHKTLSVKLSLMVVSAMAILLMASLVVMLHYSRKALREEALQKAAQTLEATVMRIDNILLNVEQVAGNNFYNLMPHLGDKEAINIYSRQIVENNPYIMGCVIAFRENHFNDGDAFMAYHHRIDEGASAVVRSETFADRPYMEQVWFTEPMASGRAAWMKLVEATDSAQQSLIIFCLPIYGVEGKPVGVMAIDVSLSLLSQVVGEVKPSANSYCVLLDNDGSFIVHPSERKLTSQTALTLAGNGADASVKDAVQAMISGETGYKPFRMNGNDFYVFYKPFARAFVPGRSMEALGWSAGIVYPEDDILGDYNSLIYYVLAIAAIGLLLLFLLCRMIIHRQLKPLIMLNRSVQRIAKGNYNEPIPDSHQTDEIGRLQDNFAQMQQSLATHMGELDQLTVTLQERGEELRKTYQRAQKADRMKVAFLHNMTNQMISPAEAIDNAVTELCKDPAGSAEQVESILQNGNAIAKLLADLIEMSDEKGGAHD